MFILYKHSMYDIIKMSTTVNILIIIAVVLLIQRHTYILLHEVCKASNLLFGEFFSVIYSNCCFSR